MSEYEFEPVPGLPEPLPEGERLLWQGQPGLKNMARRAFHLPEILGYFGVLLAWYAVSVVTSPATSPDGIMPHLLGMAGLMGAALVLIGTLAWLTHTTTVYTITTKRVVIRAGIALPIVLNLPFKKIEAAGLKMHADGTGDIVLSLEPGTRLGYLMLWPHARPWHLSRAEPMLRGIKNAGTVAPILSRALAAESGLPAQSYAETEWHGTPSRSPAPAAA